MAARIKFLIEFFSEDGKSMRLKEVKRGLHAHRYVEFDNAIKLLAQLNVKRSCFGIAASQSFAMKAAGAGFPARWNAVPI
jgi:hypothetical protein